MNWFPATLTILNGQTNSDVLDLSQYGHGNHCYRLLFVVPSSVTETISVQVSFDNSTYVTLQSGAVDITLPTGKATQLYGIQVRYVRVQAGATVGGNRVMSVSVAAE